MQELEIFIANLSNLSLRFILNRLTLKLNDAHKKLVSLIFQSTEMYRAKYRKYSVNLHRND